MIDLTPLDVRNKRGDFKKGMRGYDPQEVDLFLELIAERLEALVRENIHLRDRAQTLQQQVEAQAGREQAVQDALVTAQELRKDIREQSQREADHAMREAESEARRMIAEADQKVRARLRGVERQMDHARDSLQELERRRARFLQDFRTLLQRELDVVAVEEERTPLEPRAIDMELGVRPSAGARRSDTAGGGAESPALAGASAATDADDRSDAGEGTTGGDAGTPPETDEASGQVADEDEASGRVADEEDEASGDGAEARLDDDVGEATHRDDGDADGWADAARTVEMSDLEPTPEASSPKAPPPSIDDQPSSLELELMAGAEGGVSEDGSEGFPDVPDLETVLAEAGIDEVRAPPSEEISPPPAERRPEDSLVFFDKDEEDRKKR